jgi:hypothetical protein
MRQEALLVQYSGQREPQARFARELATVGGRKPGDCRHLFFEFEDLARQAFAFGLARIQGSAWIFAGGHATTPFGGINLPVADGPAGPLRAGQGFQVHGIAPVWFKRRRYETSKARCWRIGAGEWRESGKGLKLELVLSTPQVI